MGGLSQRIAVVSGGSSGIGLAVVTQLLVAGYKVAFFGQHSEHVDAALTALHRQFDPNDILGRRADISVLNDVQAFFAEVEQLWRKPDILICNAGISPKTPEGAPTPFASMDLEEWHGVLAVNLTGAMLCCQAVIPSMTSSRFGRIILVGSIAGRTLPKVAGAAYVASKAGLSGLCRSLVASSIGSGVTINVVAPGRVLTEMAGSADSPVNTAILERVPVGRLGTPDDIAHAITFLASSEAGFINGAILDVNGGEFAPL
ncbi:SDR family oxidoreductase [Rhizobium glycinendophyticum]|uniref:SDR family oxidoreductase n=2 Tax=Rhizobium glycinendophyticum TaxID=2589807 RepID=A0A504U2K1_9HYPH|nr:3-oxoacyl-ACP reductase FabG [Rhizobium glycinendophyticum]TPP04585.1 SDR family oxidoreductase [Rhizobium glycinendophyticum]